MTFLILTNAPEAIIPEIKQSLDEAFKELFEHNYRWLIVLSIITFIIVILFMMFYLISNKAKYKKLKTEKSVLLEQINLLEQKIHSLSSSNRKNISELNTLNLKIAKIEKELNSKF